MTDRNFTIASGALGVIFLAIIHTADVLPRNTKWAPVYPSAPSFPHLSGTDAVVRAQLVARVLHVLGWAIAIMWTLWLAHRRIKRAAL